MKKQEEQPTIDIEAINAFIDEIEYELVFKLLLGVSNNIIVEEEDTNRIVYLDGKPICYPKSSFNDFNIVKFDPFFNRKLTNFLFQRYMHIYLTENPDKRVISYFLANDLFTNETFAVVRTTKGDIESNRFVNETLCWIDLIYKMDGAQFPYEEFYKLDQAIVYMRNSERNQ